MKKEWFFCSVLILLVLSLSCSFSSGKKQNPAPFTKKLLINESSLEKVNCLTPASILVCKDGIYLGSKQESTIAKFTMKGKPIKKYQHTGQGPGEFSGFFNIFLFKNNIAVFTGRKIIILDKDLNFIKELTSPELSYFTNPFYSNNTFFGTAIKKDKWIIKILNDNLKVIDEIPVNHKIPFNWNKVRNLFFFYAFHPLFSKMIITSGIFFNNKNCMFEVIDITTRKIIEKYSWQNHKFKCKENEVKQLKNFYSFSTIAETNKF